ncbi:two-component system sensor histidine kinase NtrB [Desulfosporosinus shakirovi]|uniref:two-component system sensor histidine kinase NtrB n=1 Tax=Desulfosporosinus shakirovi TaxID=2885154 RepID=UPI001E603672|nr:PAS domain S-box protein [Desulfosporosinus sp. SRJS8]MCB8817199.1 PAS domain S-box protein [Desulfosporosinus sp. SRJS8]
MKTIKINNKFIINKSQKEFLKNKVFSNYFRLRILSMVLLLLDWIFLFTDYRNYQQGLWSSTPGYEWLFYSHVVFGLGTTVITILYWHTNLKSVEDVRWIHNVYEICFAVFCLVMAAVITGWVDQRIHGQLTVYIMVCLIIAVFFSLSPMESFWAYFLSYIIVILGIARNQPDSLVLNGHYINTFMLIFVSWVLSLTLYNSKLRDFLHQNSLESLVKERTRELEEINHQLMKEVGERKQVERKIFRLASIVESTEDGIIGMTLEGIIIDWNRGAECIYGYSEEEMVGLSVRKLFPADKQFELDDILLTISLGKSVSHFETTRQRKDGRIIEVHLTVSPIKNHNETIIGASTIVRDVTAQKKIEKEMTRMDQMNLVGEMAASIGHEVRNPMTTVRGFLQLLAENTNSAKYSGYIPLMISELDRANHIITEFLSISRTKVTEATRHNLNDIINSILPLVQVDAIRSDKCVTTQLDVIPDLILDDKEMRQMILNLARNGFEAMSKGGCLIIRTHFKDEKVILVIQDEGTGIKPEIIDRLGTPFLTTKETGTGLGLAVCYGIVARHNATITIESSPMGSTFFVKFKVPLSIS